MNRKTVVLDVPVARADPAAKIRRAMSGQQCTYDGVVYNEGAIICGDGQLLQCRDGGWDVIKPSCD